MLALEKYEERQSVEPDLSEMSGAEGISFCFGQDDITDKVSIRYGKYINKILLILNDSTSYNLPKKTFGSGSPLNFAQASPAEVEEQGLIADTLTITVGYYGGPYQTKKIFSLEELYDLDLTEQAYTYIDNMPAVVLESARGARLSDILDAAGIDVNSVESFHFYCSDVKNSWYQSINKEYLIDTIRYYYPKLQISWDYENGSAGPGAADGAEEVETVIALEDNWLRFAAEPDFGSLVKENRFRLVFGQTDTTTRNAYRSAKWIHTIEVMLGGKPPETQDQDPVPLPEVAGSEYRHDDTLGEAAGENAAGIQNWRVYEMSEEAEELTEAETENPLLRIISVMAVLIFLFGTVFEIIRFYREV